jgi:hypothetical protein
MQQSVELCRPFRVKEVLEKPRYLSRSHTRQRQWWELVGGEKIDRICFLFGMGVSANKIAQKKQLIGMVRNRRMAVKVTV